MSPRIFIVRLVSRSHARHFEFRPTWDYLPYTSVKEETVITLFDHGGMGKFEPPSRQYYGEENQRPTTRPARSAVVSSFDSHRV
eukprot:scaffold4975_cov164-Amphora_coffeaeformis.AAC.6